TNNPLKNRRMICASFLKYMTEKELIKQLASLKSVAADKTWSDKTREVLSYQISHGTDYTGIKLGFFAHLSILSRRLMQPTSLAALIVLFFVGAVTGVNAFRNRIAPGGPLYIAKTISERAQLVTTF